VASITGGRDVTFGVKDGENRGSVPMNPPKVSFDPYFWMRDDDRKNPQVIEYLNSENEYCASKTKHLDALKAHVYTDLLGHVKETDESVPYPYGAFEYYSRTIKGESYRIYCRRKKGSKNEEVLLDMNVEAKGKKHCDLGGIKPSPDHRIIGYTLDENGYETYKAKFKNLETGELLNEQLLDQTSSLVWGKDNSVVFYATQDESHRPYRLYMHTFGDEGPDQLLHEELDEEYWMGFYKTLSGRFLICEAGNAESSEFHYIDLDSGGDYSLKLFHPREAKLRYDLDHRNDLFYMVTNADGAINQKIMVTPITDTARSSWSDLVKYNPKIYTESLICFKDFIVVEGREGGFSAHWIFNPKSKVMQKITGYPDPVSKSEIGVNREYDTTCVRILYESMVTPTCTYDVDLRDSSKKNLVHQKEIPNYDQTQYKCKRITAKGHDGTEIPMAMVFKKGSFADNDNKATRKPGPMLLDAYGSYGICSEPDFVASFITLLDRGMVVCVAQIRGGSEMGRSWYEDEGKYLKKKNTFKDFISCAEHLTHENYTNSEQLAITGRSAGGLLMGAVVNMAPHLFKCVVAGVPFVDLMNTMCDPSIPLTTLEWTEWGNPNEEKYYQYMLEYSPYDNVTAQKYPAMLVLAGLYDPRVAYWEPAKWVARLRTRKTDDNLLLLKTDMVSGHFSASDRYKYYREKSFELAFILDQVGLGTLK